MLVPVRALFRCVFRSHCHVRSAVPQLLLRVGGSYALCSSIRCSCIFTVHISAIFSSALQCFERSNTIEIYNRAMFNFFLGLSNTNDSLGPTRDHGSSRWPPGGQRVPVSGSAPTQALPPLWVLSCDTKYLPNSSLCKRGSQLCWAVWVHQVFSANTTAVTVQCLVPNKNLIKPIKKTTKS